MVKQALRWFLSEAGAYHTSHGLGVGMLFLKGDRDYNGKRHDLYVDHRSIHSVALTAVSGIRNTDNLSDQFTAPRHSISDRC
jgi:hypothetical protein